MSYFTSVSIKDSEKDAFGRLKTSQPFPLFDQISEYSDNQFFWAKAVSGNGDVSHEYDESCVLLTTGGTTAGDSAVRQTRAYHRYQPGRSFNLETTFVMGAAQTGGQVKIGYFDGSNGIYLRRTDSTYYLCRKYISNEDEALSQDDWNVDSLDGTGKSGINLNFEKAQIMFIQFQFLGVGRVQVGFVVDGIPYVAHQFLNTNNLTTVYMRSGCLPVRAEVENLDTVAAATTLKMVCTSVSSGGEGLEKLQFSASNGNTLRSTSTTFKAILSVKASDYFGGQAVKTVANLGQIRPVEFNIYATGAAVEYRLILNATLTNDSWADVGATSIAEYDVSATTLSGGTVIQSGYIPASNTQRGSVEGGLRLAVPLCYCPLDGQQDILTIAVRTFTGTGDCSAALTWVEYS